MSRRTIRIVALVVALFAGVSGVLGYNFVNDKNIIREPEIAPNVFM